MQGVSLLRPRAVFDRVSLHQDVTQRCFDFDPNTVRAGTARDITVTVELINNIDESRDHVWRVEVDGEGLGFRTTTVPAGETVTDDQTRTIPADLLPTDGGFILVNIQQLGGQQQRSRCGDLEVLPTEEEPTVDPRLIGFEGCEIVPDQVAFDELFEIRSFWSNGNTVDVTIDVRFTADGSQFARRSGVTVPAGATNHEILFETSAELERFDSGQTLTINVEGVNPDIGFELTGRCGSVSIAGVFNPANVSVPPGECTVSPLEVSPPQDVDLSATVVNDNRVAGGATVVWTWMGQRLATADVQVGAGGRATASARATIDVEGRDHVTAEVTAASSELSRPHGGSVGRVPRFQNSR